MLRFDSTASASFCVTFNAFVHQWRSPSFLVDFSFCVTFSPARGVLYFTSASFSLSLSPSCVSGVGGCGPGVQCEADPVPRQRRIRCSFPLYMWYIHCGSAHLTKEAEERMLTGLRTVPNWLRSNLS